MRAAHRFDGLAAIGLAEDTEVSSVLWSLFFMSISFKEKVRNTLTENGAYLRGQVTMYQAFFHIAFLIITMRHL